MIMIGIFLGEIMLNVWASSVNGTRGQGILEQGQATHLNLKAAGMRTADTSEFWQCATLWCFPSGFWGSDET